MHTKTLIKGNTNRLFGNKGSRLRMYIHVYVFSRSRLREGYASAPYAVC